MALCQIVGCERPATVRLDVGGYCRIHYIRDRGCGRIPLLPKPTALERYHAGYAVDPDTGCFIWTRSKDRRGYGLFSIGNKTVRVTRWIYEQKVGSIPDGYQLDHFACSRPSCVNPLHLRPVTPRENVLRGDSIQAWNLARTHCDRGHAFTPDNTATRPGGARRCRTCSREQATKRQPSSEGQLPRS